MASRSFLIALAAMAMTSAAAAQDLTGDHLIVPGVSVGAAELEPADQGALSRALGEPAETERRGDHEIYRYGSDGETGELVVDFDLANDAPFEISTASPAYRTRQGLGVGSTEEAIRAGLGAPLCASHDEQGRGLLVYDSIWFATAAGHVTKVSIRGHLSASDFQTGPLHCAQ